MTAVQHTVWQVTNKDFLHYRKQQLKAQKLVSPFVLFEAYIANSLLFLFTEKEQLTTSFLTGSKSFKLTASLTGGNGDVAWQHAQLFSQPIDIDNEISLDITVTLKDQCYN